MHLPRFLRTTALLLGIGAAAVLPAMAKADGYPQRPVTIVVPFPPGGPSDSYLRLIAQRLHAKLGQPFIVDNRAGATGTIGSSAVARSKPDGYTLLMASNSSHLIAPLLRAKAPYDGVQDFAPITLLGRYPLALTVPHALSAGSAHELIALARAHPGELFFGSIGEGSGTHLTAELFKQKTGLNIVHVPYKGGGAVVNALLAGEVQLYFDGIGSAKEFAASGRTRILAVTGEQRSPFLPEVPTLKECGVEGLDRTIWLGLFAPRGTPAPIVAMLSREIRSILETDTEIQRRFADAGMEVLATPPEQIPAALRAEQKAWKALIDGLNIRLD